jgi:hypothetical protein
MRFPLAASALAAVLTLAGCGGSHAARSTTATPLSRAAYSRELQQVGRSLVAALNSLGQRSSDFKRIETHVGTGQEGLRRAASRLAAISPPADARADNMKLVSGMRAFATALTGMKRAAASRNLKTVVAADRAVDRSPAVRAMMSAATDLQRKGYRLGQLAPSSKG